MERHEELYGTMCQNVPRAVKQKVDASQSVEIFCPLIELRMWPAGARHILFGVVDGAPKERGGACRKKGRRTLASPSTEQG